MTIDFDAQVRLADLRTRVHNKEDVTPLEYRDLLMDLQRGRDMAAAASATATAKAKKILATTNKPKINVMELFDKTWENAINKAFGVEEP